MPAPNDLTQEEQQMFSQGGLPDLGPGREPVGDEQAQQQQQPDDQQQQQAEPPQHSDRRPNGQFKSKEELEAEAAAQQQQPAPDGQQPEGQQQEPKMVPLAALHEARQKAAEASRQAQMLSARMNAILMSQQGQGQQQQPQMPDLNADPAAYIQALEGRLQQFEQQWSQTNEERQLDQALNQDEQLFATTQPDYDVASDYYVQSRARELLQFHPPQEAQQIMLAEAREIAKQSWQRGMSPAQTVYNLAIARGYQMGQQQQPQQQAQQQQPLAGPRPADQVRAITNGQQASRSLSGGGSGATQALNAEAVLSMSDDEFEKYIALGQKGANDRFAQIA